MEINKKKIYNINLFIIFLLVLALFFYIIINKFQKDKNSTVLGAIYKISKKDEKELDVYEDYPKTYIKKYFKILGKKVMFYYMPKKTMHVPPSKRYLNLIIQGYKDCGYKNNYIVISRNKKVKVE